MENHGTEVPGGPSLQSGPADETGVVLKKKGKERTENRETSFL